MLDDEDQKETIVFTQKEAYSAVREVFIEVFSHIESKPIQENLVNGLIVNFVEKFAKEFTPKDSNILIFPQRNLPEIDFNKMLIDTLNQCKDLIKEDKELSISIYNAISLISSRLPE